MLDPQRILYWIKQLKFQLLYPHELTKRTFKKIIFRIELAKSDQLLVEVGGSWEDNKWEADKALL